MNPFHEASPHYARVRPSYPVEAVDVIVSCADTSLGRRVASAADIGAGTGKMTLLLAGRGLRVEAVEPSAPMRAHLREALALESVPVGMSRFDVSVHQAKAEATGLPDGGLDLAVYAQSWHWLDPEKAKVEAARILCAGGLIAAVWNQMDVSIPWVHRLTRIMRSGDVHRPDDPPSFGPNFTEPALTIVSWQDTLTPEQILDLGTTRSSYLGQDEVGRARMHNNLRWYLYDHLEHAPGEPVAIPYSTLVWTASKR